MNRDQVFISYSHADSEWLKRLQIMLAPLRRQGMLDVWEDTRIQVGQVWKAEIEKALERAKVAVLLVSPDFLASDFIAKHELPPLLEAARKQGTTILWVPLRHSLYRVTDIARYQAAYDPGTPLSTLTAARQDAALVRIAEALIAIESSPSSIPPPKTQEPVRPDRVVLPPVKYIHGWLAERVQALQQQTARALGLSVEFRDDLESGGQGPVMVVIPAGRFLMGSPEGELERRVAERQHEAQVAVFAIGKYAVTVGQFKRFVEARGYRTEAEKGGGCNYWMGSEWKQDPDKNWRNPGFPQTDNHPVVGVGWNDAMLYVDWLSEQSGQQYRLPTEAEWEYACRAGTATPFYFVGETISTDQANYDGNYVYGKGRKGIYREKTIEVGQFPANAWGLHDMHGNVWEWTCSEYDKNYGGAELHCVSDPNSSGPRVVRGGSWSREPEGLRSAARLRGDPRGWDDHGGFRLARTLTL
jgi:formylglycine-generating enzyme required for sulfatase activity